MAALALRPDFARAHIYKTDALRNFLGDLEGAKLALKKMPKAVQASEEGATAAVFLWYFLLAGPFEGGRLSPAGLVSMAYPVADLLILAGLVSLTQREVQDIGRTILMFLTAAIIGGILADTAFAAVTLYQPAVPAAALDILFLVSRWAFLAAVIWPATHPVLDARDRENFAPLLQTNLPYVCVPVGVGLAFVAVLSLIGPNLRLYGALGGSVGIIALALLRQYFVVQENRRLGKQIEELAVVDELTGVSNRRYFDEMLDKEIARARRYQRPLSLVMLDINHFKEYNDSRGHPEGDRLLRECAHAVKAQARVTDRVARYGGDEFVVILPETDASKSRLVVDKLRRVVQATLPPVDGLGASIGCAELQPDMSAVSLLEAADQAMYREKPPQSRR